MENSYEIIPLFPTPLFITKLPPSLAQVVPWLDNQPIKPPTSGRFGQSSENTYILETKECEDLKKVILKYATIFGNETLGYKVKEYKFTQSWISLKYPNQSHDSHTHSNSILSGVFYYGSEYNSNCSVISFHKSQHNTMVNSLTPSMDNNSESPFSLNQTTLKPQPGDLLLFPSYLPHSVPTNTTNRVRKSLAFNIVPKEGLGEDITLNRLKFN